jgi:hypothetical protein
MNTVHSKEVDFINAIPGNWKCEYVEGTTSNEMTISVPVYDSNANSYVHLRHVVNNEEVLNIEIHNSAHWFSHWLVYDVIYYMRIALTVDGNVDFDSLYFGEANSAMIGDSKWEHKFRRVK